MRLPGVILRAYFRAGAGHHTLECLHFVMNDQKQSVDTRTNLSSKPFEFENTTFRLRSHSRGVDHCDETVNG